MKMMLAVCAILGLVMGPVLIQACRDCELYLIMYYIRHYNDEFSVIDIILQTEVETDS